MRTLIAKQGQDYYWSVIPPIYSQSAKNFGQAPSHKDAEEAIKLYCKAAASEVYEGILNETRKPCLSPRYHTIVL